ncbi:maleylpyruvate isomerase family mycothiol-dependent enzyme [Amycolatopsis sp. cg5]|uniref:maleylpyruvate isomerase family mycothiol-dependent enzyme n=1 Tax=Amycolatopsis sp. cg5 TaxID=3238802 RepID=UPI0035261A67
MLGLDFDLLAGRLREQTAGLAANIDGLDPETRVPTCPKWQVRDLVVHVGAAHRWAAEIIRTDCRVPLPDPSEANPGPPGNWPEWLRIGATLLIDAVRTVGPQAKVWIVATEGPAIFWLRRLLNDTTVHHADSALTAGVEYKLDPGHAADVITEGLQLISYPGAEKLKPEVADLHGTGQTLLWQPEEPGLDGWRITRTPDGVRWEASSEAADVTVSGPVRDLMLMFTGRLPVDGVTGDRALLNHWVTHTAF